MQIGLSYRKCSERPIQYIGSVIAHLEPSERITETHHAERRGGIFCAPPRSFRTNRIVLKMTLAKSPAGALRGERRGVLQQRRSGGLAVWTAGAPTRGSDGEQMMREGATGRQAAPVVRR